MAVVQKSGIEALALEITEIARTHDLSLRITTAASGSEARIAVAMNALLEGLAAREKHLRTLMDSMKDASDDAQTANKLLRRVKDELKARKLQLDEAVSKASAANTAKSQFLANMSHEIRTPMNGILGTAELLARTELEPKQQKYVGTIIRSGRALLTIINDILDFSKVESGKIDIGDAPFDLVTCISDVVALLQPTCAAKNIALLVDIAADLPSWYCGDVGRIRQVLTNIVGNSVKFTDDGGVEVRVTGEVVGGQVNLRIGVVDTGIGIPADRIKDVFEKFSQVDSTSARRHEGTGLGLAICKSLVERMGGQIGLESTLGVGSTFWVTLPLKIHVPPVQMVDEQFELHGRKVLLIAEAGSETVALKLEQLGCLVTTIAGMVDDLTLATMLAESEHLFVIFATQTSNDDLLRDIAHVRRFAPLAKLSIINLTVQGTGVPVESLAQAGAQAYLRGPSSQDALPAALQHVLFNFADARYELVTENTIRTDLVSLSESPHGYEEVATSANGNKVLLVEDSLVNQEVAREFLEDMGCIVEVAKNGREAVTAIENGVFDIVLMDCQMPIMDGFQATRAIREMEITSQKRRIPIIALTANAFESDQKKCMAAGMSDFLSKPFEPEKFEATVRKWLGRTPVVNLEEVSLGELIEFDQPRSASELETERGRHEIHRAFEAWSNASNDAARSLLLSGPALTWAERWVQDHPDDLPEAHRHYVLRSSAAQTRRDVSSRTVREIEDVRRAGRKTWIAAGAGIVALVTAGVLAFNGTLGEGPRRWAMHPQNATSIAQVPQPGVAVALADSTGRTSRAQPELEATTDDVELPQVRTEPVAAPVLRLAVAPKPVVVEQVPASPQSLAAHSTTAASNGDSRAALLLALEAVHHAGPSENAAGGSHALAMNSILFQAIMQQTPLIVAPQRLTRGRPPLFCSDGKHVLASVDGSTLQVWDLDGGRLVASRKEGENASPALAASGSCDRLLVETDDYGVRVVSLTGETRSPHLVGHQTDLVGYGFDPTGRTVVTASRDTVAKLWDSRSGRVLTELSGHDDSLAGASFSSDGRQVVTWSEDKTARVWDAQSGRQTAVLVGHQGTLTRAMFSPDNRSLLTTSNDGVALLWRASTGSRVASLRPEKSSTMTAGFSRDGRRIITRQQNASITVWDSETLVALTTINLPAGTLRDQALSPDGRWLATSVGAGKLALWDAESGRAIAELHRPGADVVAVSFAPDGSRLLAIAQDGALLSWPIFPSLDGLAAHARSIAGPCLSASERAVLELGGLVPEWCSTPADEVR